MNGSFKNIFSNPAPFVSQNSLTNYFYQQNEVSGNDKDQGQGNQCQTPGFKFEEFTG